MIISKLINRRVDPHHPGHPSVALSVAATCNLVRSFSPQALIHLEKFLRSSYSIFHWTQSFDCALGSVLSGDKNAISMEFELITRIS
jgi:hypothetical protein